MNWGFFFSVLFGLTIFSVVILTFLFYAQYIKSKRQVNKESFKDPKEGKFFSRFIPKELEPKYHIKEHKITNELTKSKYNPIYTTLILSVLFGLGYIVFRFQDQFIKPIDLTSDEEDQLVYDNHDLKTINLGDLQNLPEIDLSKIKFILLSNEKDANWTYGKTRSDKRYAFSKAA